MQNISTAIGEIASGSDALDFAVDTSAMEQLHAGGDSGLTEVSLVEGSEDQHHAHMQVDGAADDYVMTLPQFDGMGDGDDEVATEENNTSAQMQLASHPVENANPEELHQQLETSDALEEGFPSSEQAKTLLDDFPGVPVEPLMEGFVGPDEASEADYHHSGEGEDEMPSEEGVSLMHSEEHEQYPREEAEFLLQVTCNFSIPVAV